MFAGVWTLIKLILRRDRVKLPVWILSIVVSLIAMVPLLESVYGDSSSLTTIYHTFAVNPAGLFLTGPMDAPTFGAMMTIETVLWWGLAIAFMNILLVIRHTRQNEEMGAQELLLSASVHRAAGLISVLTVAFVANLIVAMGIGGGLTLASASWGSDNAWLYGLSMGLFGFVWATITAVVVQLVESTRSAMGISATLVGVAFTLRGIGDFMGKVGEDGLVSPMWISHLSPFGWLQSVRALTFPDWQPLFIPVMVAVVMVLLSLLLLNKRDVGLGILPSRKGSQRAMPYLKTPLGFVWYLQKNVYIGWFISVAAMVCIIGVLVPEMSSIYESSESMKAIVTSLGGQGAIIPVFLSAMLSIVVLMIVAYVIQALDRLRSEESNGRLENLLATKLSRMRWMYFYGAVTLVGGAVMLAMAGYVLAVCVNYGSDFNVNIWDYTRAGLSYWPILALFAGIYIFLLGLLPRAAGALTWVYYGFVVFLSWIAPILKLDQWVMNMSPISHVAAAPAENIALVPLGIIASISIVLAMIGGVAWKYRDIIDR